MRIQAVRNTFGFGNYTIFVGIYATYQMITPETIDKIMDATRVEEVVGEFVQLKKRGVNLIGLCPFHDEKTPSFTVSVPKGFYKCFGCGKGGNAVNFIMEHEHYSYPEALRYLARKYNVEIEEETPSPEQQIALDEKESLFNLSAFAQKYFEDQLHLTEKGKAIALTYLKERGFTLETIKKFGIGYCPDKWDEFSQTALKNGYKKEYLLQTSLSKTKDQMLYDSFRGRIIFPIHNLSGRVLGFGARIMTNEKNRPKYINSAESEIYHKGRVLYGIYFSRSPMASMDNCFVVEGYTDVMALHQAGIENVISTSGTALSTDQIKLIRRYTDNVTLLFDGDEAGIKAAFRGIDLILEQGLNVRIVLFPDGEDPDSFTRKNRPVEVKAFLENEAADFLTFKTNLLLKGTANDPIKKVKLIKEIAETIALVPEPITRTLYVQKCSALMRVEERLMVDEVNKLRRQKRNKLQQQAARQEAQEEAEVATGSPAGELAVKQEAIDVREKEVIRLLLNYGDHMLTFTVSDEDKQDEQVTITVAGFIVQDIKVDGLGFNNPHCQLIFDTYANSIEDNVLPDPGIFTEHQDDDVRHLTIDLLSEQYMLSKNWERHRIFVIHEKNKLQSNILKAVYGFKLLHVEKKIEEKTRFLNEKEENKELQHEQVMALVKDIQEWDIKRIRFAQGLNRVVTR